MGEPGQVPHSGVIQVSVPNRRISLLFSHFISSLYLPFELTIIFLSGFPSLDNCSGSRWRFLFHHLSHHLIRCTRPSRPGVETARPGSCLLGRHRFPYLNALGLERRFI